MRWPIRRVEQSNNNDMSQAEKIKRKLGKYQRNYSVLALGWVSVYRSLVIAIAILSASAAVVVNLECLENGIRISDTNETISRNDIVSVLAASSTLLTTVLGALGLEENWRANRQARDRVKQLELELLKGNPNYDLIVSKLQVTIDDRVSDSFNDESQPNNGQISDIDDLSEQSIIVIAHH
ncbi:hypothetical protein [Crocosphaera sp.]|uniref:hypothetical protein n=1 Tax=Crocosphaera sp. TaxID=2729996 RepID=UPI0026395C70|nr:hypothetical protein [Crocosphaera sp.]MDJ0578834.1 hypothetical protein [Crocosphaera sp.]